MTKTLHVAPDRTLPIEVLSDSSAIVGRKRAGKSNTAAVITEEALDASAQVIVLDPKGDWWGLRSSADGKAEGYPVVVLGGTNAMLPLNPYAGTAVCDWLLDTGHSAVLDISDLTPSDTERFCSDFLAELRKRKKAKPGPIYLVIDEADELAPQDTRFGAAFLKTLGHIVWIVKRGGFIGIGTLVVTQRPASLNKNVLTQTEMLVVLQTTGAQDIDAVDDWFKHHVTKEQRADVLASIGKLQKGEAWVLSGQILRDFFRTRFRMRRTFDSGATPEFGKAVRRPKVVAKVDLARLEGAMAKVVEEAKANDPAALRAQIRALEDRLRAQYQPTAAAPKTVKVPVLKDGQLARAEKILDRIGRIADNLREPFGDELGALEKVSIGIAQAIASTRSGAPSTLVPHLPTQWHADGRRVDGAPVRAGLRAQAPRGGHATVIAATRDDESRGRGSPSSAEPARTSPDREQRVLDAIASLMALGQTPMKRDVAAWIGVHPRGGSYGWDLKRMEDAGLIRRTGQVLTLTDDGTARAGTLDPAEARDRALENLQPRQRKILEITLREYPKVVTREAIAEEMGVHPRGGSFGWDLTRLKQRGLLEYERGQVRARGELFMGRIV